MDTAVKEAASTARSLATGAGEALHEVKSKGTNRYQNVAVHLRRRMRHAREDLTDLRESAVRRTRRAARRADAYVHDNPWKAIGATAGLTALVVAAAFFASRR